MSTTPQDDRPLDLERLLRDQWGRLLALLVTQYRRLDLAEDGLADAFEAAARSWSPDGPDNPVGWILTIARRRIVDQLRSESVLARRMPLLAVEAELTARAQEDASASGQPQSDERLRLVLLCAHPQLSREAAAALALRLVLGVHTADIARLFLVSTPTMAARLTRARKRLAGARFDIPDGEELSDRLGTVADFAYLTFTLGYLPGPVPGPRRTELVSEAIRLVRVVRSVLPRVETELEALLALMLLQHSRCDARVVDNRLVLLPDQDRSRWRFDEIAEAVELLHPLVHRPATPFLLQALIAAEHAIAATAAETDWGRILQRYEELLTLSDTPAIRLNRAVALAEVSGPLAGLEALDAIPLAGHRLPAVRAELLAKLERFDEAHRAFEAATALCDNEIERSHLESRIADLNSALHDHRGTL